MQLHITRTKVAWFTFHHVSGNCGPCGWAVGLQRDVVRDVTIAYSTPAAHLYSLAPAVLLEVIEPCYADSEANTIATIVDFIADLQLYHN